MADKLTLNTTVSLLLQNNFPFEIVPGKTQKSFRHHLLVIHPEIPEFYIVFGDVAHGSLLDAIWVSGPMGTKIRAKEKDLLEFISKPIDAPRWTREMPLADNPVRLPFEAINRDLGTVQGFAQVIEKSEAGLRVKFYGSDQSFILETELDAVAGAMISFQGTYHFPNRISDVTVAD